MSNLIFDEVTVVICSFLSHEKLSKIISTIDNKFKILIIDNAREFNKKNYYNNFSNVNYYIPEKDLGLSKSYNYALYNVSTPYIFITQPDVTLEPDAINKLYDAIKKYNNSAILASKVVYDDNQVDTDYRLLKFNKNNKVVNFKKKFRDIFLSEEIKGDICVDAVTCTTMFINCEFIKKIGGWDNNFFMYCEDMDLCLRARINGYQIIKVFDSKVKHLGFSSHSEDNNKVFNDKRNWHWSWSQIYFHRKHNSNYFYYKIVFKLVIISFIKMILYFLMFKKKYRSYFFKFYGGIVSSMNLHSFYRSKH
jgi:N-acetylglucosaminyl-diphospho-decaprenol L-rhamnosyltransferase